MADIRWREEFDGYEARCECGWWAFAPRRGASRGSLSANGRKGGKAASCQYDEEPRDDPTVLLDLCLSAHGVRCEAF